MKARRAAFGEQRARWIIHLQTTRWRTYDSVCGPDSTPIVGVAFSKRNPEYIYTKLTKRLTQGEAYTITIWFKPLNTSQESLEYLSLAMTKRKIKNTSSLKLGSIFCIPAARAKQGSGWYLLHERISGNGGRWLTIGPFLEESALVGNQDGRFFS